MRKQQWRNLAFSSFLILTACQSVPATEVSLTGKPAQEDTPVNDPTDLTPTAEIAAIVPNLDVSERQEIEFINHMSNVLQSARSFPQEQFEHLAGLILVAQSLEPRIIDLLNQREGFLEKIQPLLDYIEGLPHEKEGELMKSMIREYHLNRGGAVSMNIDDVQSQVKYDPVRGTSQIVIPIETQSVEMQGNPQGFIRVRARTLNSQTLQEEFIDRPVLSAVLEPAESFIFANQLVIEVEGTVLGWSDISVAPGLLDDASGDPLFIRFFHTQGLSGADAVMALAPLVPGPEGKVLLTPRTYGAPEPQLLPAITDETQLADLMDAKVTEILQRHMAAGEITQEEINAVRHRFETDPTLAALHHFVKAVLQIATEFKITEGDRVADILLGQNHSGMPVAIFLQMTRNGWP